MNLLEKQLNTLKDVRITSDVKSRMREELSAYVDLHTVPAQKVATVSPFSFYRLYVSFATFAFIIAALGGTAYAAEGSLPGDTLYPVKVSVTEPIQTAIIPSARGKASWHAILAERRLEEAAKLAERDRLTPDAQTKLAANFDTQVAASQENADRLERSGDSLGSLDVRSDLEARITAHEQILGTVVDHFATANTAASTTIDMPIRVLLADVQKHQSDVISSRLALELAIAPRSAKAKNVTASTTAQIAIATSIQEQSIPPTPEQHVQRAENARAMEVDSILEKHAVMLARFAPLAGTSTEATTTTATSTQETATSSEENLND